MTKHDHFNKVTLRNCRVAGAVFTALAATISFMFGWSIGPSIADKVVYGIGLAIASGVVGYSLVIAYRAAHYRKWLVAGVAMFAFFVSLSLELVGHFGYAAAARNHDIDVATHTTNTYSDTRAQLDAARAELASVPKARPTATVEAEIDKLRARKGFEETRGCQSDISSYPSLCKIVAGLRGELGASQQRELLTARIERLTDAAASQGVGSSIADAQVKAIASMATFNASVSAKEQFWTNQLLTALVTLFMVTMGACLNFMGSAFDEDDTPSSHGVAAPQMMAPAVAPNVVTFQATPAAIPGPSLDSLKISGVTGLARIAS